MTDVFADLMGSKEETSAMDDFNKSCKLSYTTVRGEGERWAGGEKMSKGMTSD
jgi:hypothetical protein